MMNALLLSYEKDEKAAWQEDSLSHVPLVNEEDSFFSSEREEKDDSLTTGDDNRRMKATRQAREEAEISKEDEDKDTRERSWNSSIFSVENSLMKEPSIISAEERKVDDSDDDEEEESEEEDECEEEEHAEDEETEQQRPTEGETKDEELCKLEQRFFSVKTGRKSLPLYLSVMKQKEETEKETEQTRGRLLSAEGESSAVPRLTANSASQPLDISPGVCSSQKERRSSVKSKSFISSEGLEEGDDNDNPATEEDGGDDALPLNERRLSRRRSNSRNEAKEGRVTAGRKALIRSNPLLRSEVYLFYLPIDEAIEVVLKRIPLNEFLPYLSSSLFEASASSSFFDEKVTSLFEKVILYQRKRNCDEREEKREATARSEVNQRLKRLLPILLEEDPSLSTINNAMNATNNTRNSMILPSASSALVPASAASSSNNKFAKILASFNCEGDCILLLRRKEDSAFIEILLSLFRQWERDYLPLLALRQEKAGKEKQWKLSNQEKFTKHILSICQRLLPLTESLFGCHSRNGETFYSSLSSCPSSSASLSHYYQNEDSILLKFTKLLFYWFDNQKKEKAIDRGREKESKSNANKRRSQRQQEGNEWKEILMKMNRGNIPSVFFSSGRNDLDSFLSQFDCRIVEYSVSNSSSNLLVNDPYFQYLFLLFQGKVTPPSISSASADVSFLSSASLPPVVSLFDEAVLPYDNQLLLSPLHCLCGIYQLHCVSCSLALSQCSFPHCSFLRSKWRLSSSRIEESEGIEVNEKRAMLILQDIVFGFLSGEEVEKDERKTRSGRGNLLSSDLCQDLGITSLKKDSLLLLTVEEETKEEEKKDQEALSIYQSSLSLLSKWNTSQQQIRWLEFLSLFLVSPEILKSGITADDLLSSKGGLLYLQVVKDKEEFLSSLDSMLSLLPFILIQDSTTLSKKKRASSMLRSSFFQKHVKEVSNTIWQLKLPMQTLYDVLPIGYSFDPYPSSSSLNSSSSSSSSSSLYPLSEKMYSQVMNQLRLSIQVPSLSPYRLFDAGRYSSSSSSSPPSTLLVQKEERILSFDRLLTEGIVRGSDGKASFLVVQFMYGIFLDDSTLLVHHRNSNRNQRDRHSEERKDDSGAVDKEEKDLELSIPRAGLRFISIDQLQSEKSSFVRGITALVYDVSSEISRATFLTERQLLKYLDVKGLNKEKGLLQVNYHQISQLLLKDASLIIEITRIESYFISASFQFHKLLSQRREIGNNQEATPELSPLTLPLSITPSSSIAKKEIIIQEVTRSSCRIDSRNLTKSLINQYLSKK
jgi:hypothetical protein